MPICTFSRLTNTYAVVRLDARAPLPVWTQSSDRFLSITRTPDELSIVCAASAIPPDVPPDVRVEPGWRGIRLHGPFAFDEVGILASIAVPLAAARIGIFAISTFDTDYVFVKEADLHAALAALIAAGHVDASDVIRSAARDLHGGDATADPSPRSG